MRYHTPRNESACRHGVGRPPVQPATTGNPPPERGEPVLEPRDHRLCAANMLEQPERAAVAQHAPELGKRTPGVRKRAEGETHDPRIEGARPEWKRLGVRAAESP